MKNFATWLTIIAVAVGLYFAFKAPKVEHMEGMDMMMGGDMKGGMHGMEGDMMDDMGRGDMKPMNGKMEDGMGTMDGHMPMDSN